MLPCSLNKLLFATKICLNIFISLMILLALNSASEASGFKVKEMFLSPYKQRLFYHNSFFFQPFGLLKEKQLDGLDVLQYTRFLSRISGTQRLKTFIFRFPDQSTSEITCVRRMYNHGNTSSLYWLLSIRAATNNYFSNS